MRLLLMSVFDLKTGAFMPPYTSVALGQGVRMFEDAVTQKDSPMNRHPEDYSLYHLGDFDDNKGEFHILDRPQALEEAANVVRKGGTDRE